MYRARSVLSGLTPLAPQVCGAERFASWLVKSQPKLRNTKVYLAEPYRLYASRAATEPFINGTSSSYVEEMYNAWLTDPQSVHVVSIINFIIQNIFYIFTKSKWNNRYATYLE